MNRMMSMMRALKWEGKGHANSVRNHWLAYSTGLTMFTCTPPQTQSGGVSGQTLSSWELVTSHTAVGLRRDDCTARLSLVHRRLSENGMARAHARWQFMARWGSTSFQDFPSASLCCNIRGIDSAHRIAFSLLVTP